MRSKKKMIQKRRMFMKFIHMADMHLDRPFVNLSEKENFGELRRLEQRKVFKKIIQMIQEEAIDYLFITGDLYEQEYIQKTTIDFINQLFGQIPNTKVLITPGNHDPYFKNSYYAQYQWNDNVKIFKPEFEKIEFEDIAIYGYGFGDYYCQDCGIDDLEIQNPEKMNLLLLHATLDGANIEDMAYNSISKRKLLEKGFDYVGLGHIHKTNYQEVETILYPGSTVSLGFDELGEHGVILGEWKEGKLRTKFIPMDEEEFIEKQVDITGISSTEFLIEELNCLSFSSRQFVKIVLIGERQFEINRYEIMKLISQDRIIKIKDQTVLPRNLEKIANQSTLRGIFVKECLKKLEMAESEEEKQKIQIAIEIGLDALQ